MCECVNWCRVDGLLTNHHPNCPHFNDSLITVWRIQDEGGYGYVTDDKDVADEERGEGIIITEERMHKEIYNNLGEFQGW